MIVRAPRAEHYTVLNTATFNLPLPADTLGVYLFLLSKPDNWKVMPEALASHFNMGKSKVYRILKELRSFCVSGRPLIEQVPNRVNGKIESYDYIVHEPLPQNLHPEKLLPENQETEKLETENGTLQITDKPQRTDQTKRVAFDDFWSAYPNKRGKEVARKKWPKLTAEEQQAAMADVKRRPTGDLRWRDGYVPDGSTYVNQKRWEDEWQGVACDDDVGRGAI